MSVVKMKRRERANELMGLFLLGFLIWPCCTQWYCALLLGCSPHRTRTRTNTNPNGTEANAASRSVRASPKHMCLEISQQLQRDTLALMVTLSLLLYLTGVFFVFGEDLLD